MRDITVSATRSVGRDYHQCLFRLIEITTRLRLAPRSSPHRRAFKRSNVTKQRLMFRTSSRDKTASFFSPYSRKDRKVDFFLFFFFGGSVWDRGGFIASLEYRLQQGLSMACLWMKATSGSTGRLLRIERSIQWSFVVVAMFGLLYIWTFVGCFLFLDDACQVYHCG